MVLSMDRWRDKVAVVTGAGGGIGGAIIEKLLEENLQVVGIDNRARSLEELSEKLQNKKGKLHTFVVDVTKEKEILEFFNKITSEIGTVHVLVNCAAVISLNPLIGGDTETWRKIMDVNVIGLCTMTREAVKIMKINKIDGHIIHLGSMACYSILKDPFLDMYPPSKFALRAITESHRQEFNKFGLKIKVTLISTGKVNNNMHTNNSIKIDFDKYPGLESSDVADSVVYVLSTPPRVQVHEIMVRPAGQDY